ncbi:MAG: amidohydrolase family protein [Hyphomonadaceae bacterium]|nr:amidohydrolase family protein [Hyphomonadaceae bacterium]
MRDLIIKNALIADGQGGAPFSGDLAVEGERIVAVGKVEGRARREIDAGGRLVTPGWVDPHTHYDGQATWDSMLAPSSTNGVTSVVMGNCGVGFAPAAPDKHDWLIGLLEGVEDIPGTALAEGLPWAWETFPQYLDFLASRRFAIDCAAHVPHAPLRAYVMGERGADHTERPTADEIAAMRRAVCEGVQAGAVGFATSRTVIHRTRSGDFVGTMTASAEELTGIGQGLNDAGAGVFQLVSDLYLTTDEAQARREIALLGTIARTLRRPLSFTVEQVDQAPDRWREMLDAIAGWNAEGLDVKAQVAPRPIGLTLGLMCSRNSFSACPSYHEIAKLPLAGRLTALRDPARRARILAEHGPSLPDGLAGFTLSAFHRLFPFGARPDYEPTPEHSLAAEAARLGKPVLEHAYDRLIENDGAVMFYLPLNNYAHGDLEDVRAMMTSPHALFGLSDGGAHCNFICDGTFPTTALAHWTKDRTRGPRLPLEYVVHQQTQRAARHVGWFDRGVIAPGYLADINVIDLDRLALTAPRIVADLPAGGTRLMQDASGYDFTFKRGVAVFEGGAHTGALPGVLVRGRQTLH